MAKAPTSRSRNKKDFLKIHKFMDYATSETDFLNFIVYFLRLILSTGAPSNMSFHPSRSNSSIQTFRTVQSSPKCVPRFGVFIFATAIHRWIFVAIRECSAIGRTEQSGDPRPRCVPRIISRPSSWTNGVVAVVPEPWVCPRVW